jgi:hypothetical protein
MQVRTLPRAHGPRSTAVRPSVLSDEVLVAAARNLAYELPLGHAPLPLAERRRGGWSAALRRLERALAGAAARHGVPVDVGEGTEALAHRLARANAISPAAADAVTAVVPVLRRGAAGDGRPGLEIAAIRVAERVTGYLRWRAA